MNRVFDEGSQRTLNFMRKEYIQKNFITGLDPLIPR